MTNIELRYDAFNVKTILTVDGKEDALRCFGTGRGTLLHDWIDRFFPEIIDRCSLGPGSECTVQFYGTQSDFTDVSNAYNDYQKDNKDVEIKLPDFKRYPQSLNEIREYVENKLAQYRAEIVAKKEDLEKLDAALAKKQKLELENTAANLDALEYKANQYKKSIKGFLKKEGLELDNIIKELKQASILDKKELPPDSTDQALLGELQRKFVESQKKVLDKSYKAISHLASTFADTKCDLLNGICENYLSDFPTMIHYLSLVKPVLKYHSLDINSLESLFEFKKSFFGLFGDSFRTVIQRAYTAINTEIDAVEQYCRKTLSDLTSHYMGELARASKTILAIIVEKRESFKSDLEKYHSTSEDRKIIENEILQLEAKSECLTELSAEIGRIHGDNNE